MSPLIRLFQYARPHRTTIVYAAIYSFLNKLFDILPEVLIGVAVDIVVNQQQSFIARLGVVDTFLQLIVLGILTLFIWAFESLFQYLYSIKWRNLAQILQHDLRLDAFKHMLKLEISYFENKSTGQLLSVLNDDINQLERFLDGGANSIIQLATSTILIGAIFIYISPVVAVFALIPVPVILMTAFKFERDLGPRYSRVREEAGLLGAQLANSITGMATIKSYTADTYEIETLQKQSQAYQNANRAAIARSAAFIPVVRMAIVGGFIATIILGGYKTLHGSIAVGSYSVLIFLTQRLLWPFTELAAMTDLFERAMASAKRALDLIQTPIRLSHEGNALALSSVKGRLEFKNVSFHYQTGSDVIRDVSFKIPAGSTVAFVGATGAGKSTLTKLMLRFDDPTTGSILLDEENIKNVVQNDLRRAIAFVSQDVFLFHGTVRENIAYGSFDASDADIVHAAKMAEAHDFIMKLPEGYNTVVGERGQKLSGGQRQRLSIARAVLKNAPIFILDEATSAVDNETEAAIQKSMNEIAKGRTTVLIAHRLSTIRHADCIYVLEQGKIIEQGTHEQLLLKQGVYHSLWSIQTGEIGN